MRWLRRWNPFRRTFLTVTPVGAEVVARATISQEADLTLLQHRGQVELLCIDMATEDAESFVFPAVGAAKAFANDRFGVGQNDWM